MGLDSAASFSRESSSSVKPGSPAAVVFFPFRPFPLFFVETKFPALVLVILCEDVVRAVTVEARVPEDLAAIIGGMMIGRFVPVMDSEPANDPESVWSNGFLPMVVPDSGPESMFLEVQANISYILTSLGIDNLPRPLTRSSGCQWLFLYMDNC
jgi:hypothetical protein